MIDIVILLVFGPILIYFIIWLLCLIFNIPIERYEQKISQSKIGQLYSEIDIAKYILIAFVVGFLYDGITECDNDPLGINECKQVDPREYDSYRGRR